MFAAVLAVHITAGVLGLLIGAAAMAARKRRGWHTGLGLTYQGVVAVMTSSAVLLVVLDDRAMSFLAVIAVGTEACALAGWAVRRRHRPGWVAWHIRWMGSSYTAFATAALVVNWSSPLAWFLPTVVGTPLIAHAVSRHRRATAPGGAGARGEPGWRAN